MSIGQLAEELRAAKSTVSRLVGPMVEQRLIVKDPQTQKYRLGDGTLWLGERYLDGLDLRTVAVPFLVGLQEQTASTCHLVIREGLDVVYIDKLEDRSQVRMASRIGSRLPIYRTAVGKAILAYSPQSLFDEVVAAGLEPITDRTITDPERLNISTENAPAPAGAYNQGVVVGNIMYTGGFGPQDRANGNAIADNVADQTRQTMRNVEATLIAGGFTLADVVKTTVHLQHLSDWAEFDAAYGEFWPQGEAPARTTVGSDLANILVEIDVVAIKA